MMANKKKINDPGATQMRVARSTLKKDDEIKTQEAVTRGAWVERRKLDYTKHLKECVVCRENIKPVNLEKIFGVKNIATRQYRHAIGNDLNEALASIGWFENQVLYSMVVDDASKTTMTEKTKEYFKKLGAEKKAEKKTQKVEKPPEIIDTGDVPCYNQDTKSKRKEEIPMAKKKKNEIKEFIDHCVVKKVDGKEVVDFDSLFSLAKANQLDADKLKKYKSNLKPNTAGRIRMTIGNMLRGVASRTGKLTSPGGRTMKVAV